MSTNTQFKLRFLLKQFVPRYKNQVLDMAVVCIFEQQTAMPIETILTPQKRWFRCCIG